MTAGEEVHWAMSTAYAPWLVDVENRRYAGVGAANPREKVSPVTGNAVTQLFKKAVRKIKGIKDFRRESKSSLN
jgi:hypothetical protein